MKMMRSGTPPLSFSLLLLLLPTIVVNGQSIVTTSMETSSVITSSMYVPIKEQELFDDIFEQINALKAEAPVTTLISIAVSTDNTIIYYDHWEDDYDPDPSGDTPQASTEIWGDGVAANGCAPTVASCTDANDVLNAGDVIVLENEITIPRNPLVEIKYDGGDRVQTNLPVAMTRAGYPAKPGSLMAGAIEIYDEDDWGTSFVAPVGEDVVHGTSAYEFVSLAVMSGSDDNKIYKNGGAAITTLNQGDNIVVPVNQGDTLTSDAPIQVHLITGDVGSKYELRWYALTPVNDWSTEYYAPVGDSHGQAKVTLYNNNGASDITVTCMTLAGSYDITVPAGKEATSNTIPDGTGAKFTSANKFFAFSSTDTTSSTSGMLFDWGYPLMTSEQLTNVALIGLGYGCTGNTCDDKGERSVVWVTPTEDCDIYVDYDNDGTVDDEINAVALASVILTDSNDQDMSGAIIWATKPDTGAGGPPVNIAAAWGQKSSYSFNNDPHALDLGTVIIPFDGHKTDCVIEMLDDKDGSGDYTPEDIILQTITVTNAGPAAIGGGTITVDTIVGPQQIDISEGTGGFIVVKVEYEIPDGTVVFPDTCEVETYTAVPSSPPTPSPTASPTTCECPPGCYPADDQGLARNRFLQAPPILTRHLAAGNYFGDYDGNPQCTGEFEFDYGWKMDGCQDGTYLLNSAPVGGELSGSCGGASDIEVTVVCNDDNTVTISWTGEGDSTLAIKVKGGDGGTLYDASGVSMLSNLGAMANNGGNVPAISHIEVCVDCPYVCPCVCPTDPPTSSPTKSPSKVPTGSPTSSPTKSPSNVPTGSPTALPTKSPSNVPTGSPTASPTKSPSNVPTGSPTASPTKSPSNVPTGSPTASPTKSPSNVPTGSPTKNPTASPSNLPTSSPTKNPTASPSNVPTGSPTASPTKSPSNVPTGSPTKNPTASPSNVPTGSPTKNPTSSPSGSPTKPPTSGPTSSPSASPTKPPTSGPTSSPSASPTKPPTSGPTSSPSSNPTGPPTSSPTSSPSSSPTKPPTAGPTSSPSSNPTGPPTKLPTGSPSSPPTSNPTGSPTKSPSNPPTGPPTATPSSPPSETASGSPTGTPTKTPTGSPSSPPSETASGSPTGTPTKTPTGSPSSPPSETASGSPTGTPTKSPTATPSSPPSETASNPPTYGTSQPTSPPTGRPTGSPTGTPTVTPTGTPTKTPTGTPTTPPSLSTPTPRTPEPTPPTKTSPPTPGSSSGDPHFKTFSGDKFDYHGECDLVLVNNPSFENGLGLRLHVRTTRVKYFSFVEKVALQIGSDVLEFDNDVENFLINGQVVEPNRKHHKTMMGDFFIARTKRAISVNLHRLDTSTHKRGRAKIDFHTRKNGFPAVIVDSGKTDDVFQGSLGLLGDWPDGKKLGRDGKTEFTGINGPLDDATAFALEWQVRDNEPMLFNSTRYPQYPTTCLAPETRRGGGIGESMFRKEAEEACAHWKHDKDECVFDVMMTRDVMVAQEGSIIHIE